MTFPADFKTLLAGALSIVGDRIYPMRIPDEVGKGASQKPCLVYTPGPAVPDRTFCGYGGVTSEPIRVDAYARDYDTARAMGDTLEAAVDNFRGLVGSTQFLAVFVENAVDLSDLEPGLYRRSLGLTVWHRRP